MSARSYSRRGHGGNAFSVAEGPYTTAAAFHNAARFAESKAKVLIVLGVLLIVSPALILNSLYPEELGLLREELEQSPWVMICRLALGVSLAVLIWRTILVLRYRPAQPCADDELPTCTVVIPAYNEGGQVLDTIRSIMASDYPQHKLQVVCVDDGSRDDTWQWMQVGGSEFGDRVELVRQPVNQGKRRALYEGFRRAKGEVLVTIDSDSEVEPRTLRSLVSVFQRDPRVGAAAGNVRVLNRDRGIIPRMLEVAFTFSFDFIRASQSRVNTVMCTPGALSAYRASVVGPVLIEWLEQRFMGREARIGEDRAMTNLVLRQGHLVRFQSDAVVFTKVPVTYRGLSKMYLRWARSNIRETIALCRFAFTRFRAEPVSGARLNLIAHLMKMTLGEVFKCALVWALVSWPLLAGYNLALGLVLAATPPALFYLLRHRSSEFLWAFPYSLFCLAGLSWISLWALCTPHRNGWLTRTIKTDPEHVYGVSPDLVDVEQLLQGTLSGTLGATVGEVGQL